MSRMTQVTTRSSQVREQLGHPVIDGDGHVLEPVPLFADFLRDHGRGDIVESAPMFRRLDQRRAMGNSSLDERRRRGLMPIFWASAIGDTDYFATVTAPARYYERLDETGIDF